MYVTSVSHLPEDLQIEYVNGKVAESYAKLKIMRMITYDQFV